MDWIHLHLAVNHLPVLGTPFMLLLVLWGWARGSREVWRLGLWLLVVLASVSVPVKFTGDFAAELLEGKPSFEKAFVQRHEEAADQATTAMCILGVSAVVALAASRRGRPAPKWSLVLVAVAGLATTALLARTANFGGHIRHPEIRSVPEVPYGRP